MNVKKGLGQLLSGETLEAYHFQDTAAINYNDEMKINYYLDSCYRGERVGMIALVSLLISTHDTISAIRGDVIDMMSYRYVCKFDVTHYTFQSQISNINVRKLLVNCYLCYISCRTCPHPAFVAIARRKWIISWPKVNI